MRLERPTLGLAALAVILTVTLASCGGGGGETTGPPAVDSTKVSTVTLSPGSPSVSAGTTQQFTATARNSVGKTLTTATVSWQSSSTSVATINSSGLATAIAAGTSTITATAGGISQTSTLTVTAAIIAWTAKSDMPTARSAFTVSVVSGIIYAIGGANHSINPLNPHRSTVEAYDPVANTWSTKAFMPTARSEPTSAVVNGIIYVFGGDNAISTTTNSNSFKPVTTVESYNPVTNTWTTRAPMATARERFAAAEVGGIIYVMGGLIPDGSGFVTDAATVAAYNPATNSWAAKASMPFARSFLTAVALDGIIYAIGDQDLPRTVQAYDPVANSWTTKASLALINGRSNAFVAGGVLYAMDDNANIEAYNATSNTWSTKAGTKVDYESSSAWSLSVVNNVLYSMGGKDIFGTYNFNQSRPVP
jgi:hypothetical protein